MLMTNCLYRFFLTSVGTCASNALRSVLVSLGLSFGRVGSAAGAWLKGPFSGSQVKSSHSPKGG